MCQSPGYSLNPVTNTPLFSLSTGNEIGGDITVRFALAYSPLGATLKSCCGVSKGLGRFAKCNASLEQPSRRSARRKIVFRIERDVRVSGDQMQCADEAQTRMTNPPFLFPAWSFVIDSGSGFGF